MLQRFQQHLSKNFPFLQGKKLLLAVSGGIDSVVVTYLFHQLQYPIALAHANFQLRGEESDEDEQFVRDLAKELKSPFITQSFDTQSFAVENGISIQMAARELRYRWFEEVLSRESFDYLITAHQQDDQVETFFINLQRKKGLHGLTGIPEVNGKIIRPLLAFTRQEILLYARENSVKWREDQSNATIKYQRNNIRHRLIPVLQEIDLEFPKQIIQTMKYLQQSQHLVKDYIESVKTKFLFAKQDHIYIDLAKLTQLPHYNFVLYELLQPFGFTDWESIENLVETQSGKQVESATYTLLKDRNQLILQPKNIKNNHVKTDFIFNETAQIGNLSYKAEVLEKPEKLDFQDRSTFYFDTDLLTFPLYFRHWLEGDYFYPLGLNGRKKLSDFFTDQKLSLFDKEKIWLLCDAQNRIVWVVNYRQDNRFKITENTKNVLKIVLNP